MHHAGNKEARAWENDFMVLPAKISLANGTVVHWVPPHFHVAVHPTHAGISFHILSRFTDLPALACDGLGSVWIDDCRILTRWEIHVPQLEIVEGDAKRLEPLFKIERGYRDAVPWLWSVLSCSVFGGVLESAERNGLSIEETVRRLDPGPFYERLDSIIDGRYYGQASQIVPIERALEICDRLQYLRTRRTFLAYLQKHGMKVCQPPGWCEPSWSPLTGKRIDPEFPSP